MNIRDRVESELLEILEAVKAQGWYDANPRVARDTSYMSVFDAMDYIVAYINREIEETCNAVVGEDERHSNGKKLVNPWSCDDCGIPEEPFTRNELKATQRQHLKQLMGGK